MQEMPFQRPKIQNGISNLYIFLKSALKMQEMPFQRPKFQKIFGGACPRTPLKLCRHCGLPLTKILATPLAPKGQNTLVSRPSIRQNYLRLIKEILKKLHRISRKSKELIYGNTGYSWPWDSLSKLHRHCLSRKRNIYLRLANKIRFSVENTVESTHTFTINTLPISFQVQCYENPTPSRDHFTRH